jgi:phosphoglucomutase
MGPHPILSALPLCALLVACATNVPVGFDSGRSTARATIAASTEQVVAAVEVVLTEDGYSTEAEESAGGIVIRTGRHWIHVAPDPSGEGTRIALQIARYVGPRHQEQADQTLARILKRV